MKITLNNINDNAPVFSKNVYSVQLSCSATEGMNILSLSVSDDDVVSSLSFTVIDGDAKFFTVDNLTGDVTLNSNISTVAETSNRHVIVVSVSDGGVPELTSTAVVIVRVDDCAVSSSASGE